MRKFESILDAKDFFYPVHKYLIKHKFSYAESHMYKDDKLKTYECTYVDDDFKIQVVINNFCNEIYLSFNISYRELEDLDDYYLRLDYEHKGLINHFIFAYETCVQRLNLEKEKLYFINAKYFKEE